jgi:hypothetical protein
MHWYGNHQRGRNCGHNERDQASKLSMRFRVKSHRIQLHGLAMGGEQSLSQWHSKRSGLFIKVEQVHLNQEHSDFYDVENHPTIVMVVFWSEISTFYHYFNQQAGAA